MMSPCPPVPLTLPVLLFSPQILRQFEALCRGQPSPKSSADPASSTPCAGDLLTDTSALPGESILTPLSPALLTAAPGQEPGLDVEAPGAAVPTGPRKQGTARTLARDAPAPPRSLSLFAGMELVARPGAVLCLDPPPAEPRTPSPPQDRQTDAEGSRQPSAFAFLNM